MPLAYMRSGAVPCLASKRARIYFVGSTHLGIRLGASVHYVSLSVAERPWNVYLGSLETSVCLMWWVSFSDGSGSSQSMEVLSLL